MVAVQNKPHHGVHHSPRLQPPWFATTGEAVTLHRYFDDQFTQCFMHDAVCNRLAPTRGQPWYKESFGRKDGLTTLRLPMHQTFYIACCEVACDNLGFPAYDPKRIRSAGFVIRRHAKTGVQRWMVHEGQALGWQNGAAPSHDPDDYRRLVNSRAIQPRCPEPPYSGEECYPLHPLLVRDRKTNRSHTLLWGYLPLGGSYRLASNEAGLPANTADAAETLKKELSWPFGERNSHGWQEQDGFPVVNGLATTAFYELLELLMTRYRIFEENDGNKALRGQLRAIRFGMRQFNPVINKYYFTASGTSLLDWIEANRDSILNWLSTIATSDADIASALAQNPLSPILSSYDDICLTSQQTKYLRSELVQCGLRAMVAMESGLAMPRFGQGEEDIFCIHPFVRWQDECGCEKIHWGNEGSIKFGVTSPFDPEAQRPRAVILPDLDDLKRGAARGVSLLAPKSLADALGSIKPTIDMNKRKAVNPAGLCWSFSLSIPVITICAFILLMIVMNLLNIIFRWLPWAFLALPRLCGKLMTQAPPAKIPTKDDY